MGTGPIGESGRVQLEALDRSRLLSDVTRVLSDHVNTVSAPVVTTRDRVTRDRFMFAMADPTHLGHVPNAGRAVAGPTSPG